MKIFVTGASGFVGSAVVARLKKKHTILAMSRSEKSDAALKKLGAKPVRCELGKVNASDLKGVDTIVHAAAYVEQWGTKDDFWRANVTGTEQLLDAARAAKVKRFIFIGTEACLFYGQDMIDIDEKYPYPEKTPFLYSLTKGEAEKRVIAANTKTFATLSIRPRLVWGTGDKTVLPVLVDMIRQKKFMWMDHGAKNTHTTHILNVAHAVELALKKGNGGEVYFVTDDEKTTFREFLGRYIATQGIQPPGKSIPGAVARALAAVVEGIWKLLRLKNEPPLTRFAAAIMSRHCTIRIDKIRRDMGYKPIVTVAEGLAAMPRI
ncbi:MAG: NAD-dependent epimerase/dehydratase family protein [Turneriella sp.]|nr:NAD-dependent epimerase/dehydratase family protein [Turneriella sp.]